MPLKTLINCSSMPYWQPFLLGLNGEVESGNADIHLKREADGSVTVALQSFGLELNFSKPQTSQSRAAQELRSFHSQRLFC